MNNRFKFRAWDKINEEWLNIPHLSLDVEIGLLNGFFDYEEAAKRRYVLEQCTGLKDKNGKLIYENDLIKIDDDVAVINWSDYYARFILESSEDIFDFERSYAEECEVVGNIHENADLIKVGGK